MSAPPFAPRFEVRLSGVTLAADLADQVLSLTVETDLDLAGSFSLTLRNPRQPPARLRLAGHRQDGGDPPRLRRRTWCPRSSARSRRSSRHSRPTGRRRSWSRATTSRTGCGTPSRTERSTADRTTASSRPRSPPRTGSSRWSTRHRSSRRPGPGRDRHGVPQGLRRAVLLRRVRRMGPAALPLPPAAARGVHPGVGQEPVQLQPADLGQPAWPGSRRSGSTTRSWRRRITVTMLAADLDVETTLSSASAARRCSC